MTGAGRMATVIASALMLLSGCRSGAPEPFASKDEKCDPGGLRAAALDADPASNLRLAGARQVRRNVHRSSFGEVWSRACTPTLVVAEYEADPAQRDAVLKEAQRQVEAFGWVVVPPDENQKRFCSEFPSIPTCVDPSFLARSVGAVYAKTVDGIDATLVVERELSSGIISIRLEAPELKPDLTVDTSSPQP